MFSGKYWKSRLATSQGILTVSILLDESDTSNMVLRSRQVSIARFLVVL
jgi:hypothetical protein